MENNIHYYFIPHRFNNYQPHILRPHFLSFYSIIIILAKFFITISLFLTYPSPVVFAEITSREIINLTNQSRQEIGLNTLLENPLLSKAALAKAQDMLKRDYFNHQDPDGNPPWRFLKENGYLYSYAGENLAMDFIKAESVYKAWMKSESHRANILNPNYKEIGLAVIQGELSGKKTTLLVQLFGTTFTEEKNKFAQVSPSLTAEGPSYTELITGNIKPQLKGENIAVTIKPESKNNFLSYLNYYSQKFYWVILIFLTAALLVNIFVRIKIQHKSVIIQTLLVLLMVAIMISIKTHFLEGVPLGMTII